MSSLDPAYIDWLKETTTRLWPIIRDGHFALHTYHTNFNLGKKDIGKADEKEEKISMLCGKYGPLYSNIAFAKVDEEAWITSYRQKYRHDGDGAELLGLMAKAFEEIRRDLIKTDRTKAANSIVQHATRIPTIAGISTKSQTEYLEAIRNSQYTNRPLGQHIENPYDRDSNDDDEGYENDPYEQENDIDEPLRGGYGRQWYGWD